MFTLSSGANVIAESSRPIVYSDEQKGWVVDNQIVLDAGRIFTVSAETPKVGPIHFQMLFMPAEMVAAEELKATDKILASFWKLIDDPRTDTVDLALTGVQNAIEYTLTAVKAAGVPLDVQARKAQILTGVLQ